MLYGFMYQNNGWLVIKVDGYPRRNFLGYSKREALAKYRAEYGLKHKKIAWLS